MLPEYSPGTVIGARYRIRSTLTEGGFAMLYEADDLQEPGMVIVKVMLHSAVIDDGAAYERFAREAEIAQLLRHPHIVQTRDFGQAHDGAPYLIMERLCGGTLEQLLVQGPQEPDLVLKIVDEALAGLEEAHRIGVVHRDLKPTNIFLCVPAHPGAEPCVKLIDFGLAKPLEFGVFFEDETLTADGMLLGTPGYMAPELLQGRNISELSDIYVLGLIGHELLVGEISYKGGPLEKAQAQATHNPPPPPEPIVSSELYKALARMMERKPSRRYASATEAREDLARIARGESSTKLHRWWSFGG